MSQDVLAVRLSYRNNPDGTKPDGAVAFRYADVQVFLKKLREQYFRDYKARGEIRYIVAGERGELKDRVHWHCILYGQQPMSVLGEYWDVQYRPNHFGGKSETHTKRELIALEKDIIWSMWEHGHVHFQRPSEKGIRYCVKYCVADQWNSVKAKGKGRFEKSTDNSASKFNPSKLPPIGMPWLIWKTGEWEKRLIVPPTLMLKPEGLSGYWYPKGKLREYLLQRLYEINQRCREELGRDAAAWDALLASVVSTKANKPPTEAQLKDLEILTYGHEQAEIVEDFDRWEEQARLAEKAKDRERITDHQRQQWRKKKHRRKCGGHTPCSDCYLFSSKQEQREFWDWNKQTKAQWENDKYKPDGEGFDRWFRRQKRVNPFCRQKGDDWTRQGAFDA